MLGRIKQTDLSVPIADRRVLLLLAHRGRQAVSVHVPPQGQHGWRRGNPPRPQRARPRAQVPRARRLRRQRRWQLVGVLDRHDRLPAVQPARKGSAQAARPWPRTSSGSDRSSGRPTTRRSSTPREDPVSKRSDKFWRHTVRAAASDLLYEEKDELFDVGAGRSLDQEVIFLACLRQDVDRVPLPAGVGADSGTEGGLAARGGARVRRRSLSWPVLHHHQQATRRTSRS